ncbi:MAG: flagellar hook-basal body complex protein [Ignavibacteria bacterium]|nr:flagellar hook-basal body complex protein [Ignavibacteria bacterium]
MVNGIYHIARSLNSKIKSIDVLANNLANINSTGFKKQIPFQEYLNKNDEIQVKQTTDYGQGEVILSANPLDIAISGDGYFLLKTDNGTELTRNGKFHISEDGFLVNGNGDKVLGNNGEISFSDLMETDNPSITISKTGEIKIGETNVDSLAVVNLENPQDAIRTSDSNFAVPNDNYTTASPQNYEIVQGYLEESNVNPILEMQTMIETNKDYESAYKIMRYLDQTMEKSNQIGRVY